MAKLTLTDLTDGRLNAVSIVNANWDLIEAALENTLSRDGTSPNAMSAPLDMNSNFITNLPTPTNNAHAATKKYVDDYITGLNLDTDDIAEGATNLYYTTARANAAIDARVDTAFVSALIDTDDVSEGVTNLYYTDARVTAHVDLAYVVALGLDTDDITEGVTNLYYTDARVTSLVDKTFVDALGINATHLGGTAAASYALLASPAFTGTPTAPTATTGTNTTQLATTAFVQQEVTAAGSYNTASFDVDFATKDSDDLAEGVTNLYYTAARSALKADLTGDTFTGNITLSTTQPRFKYVETDALADEGHWDTLVSDGQWILQSRSDADAAGSVAISVQRTGTTVDEIELNATLFDFNGALNVSGNVTLQQDLKMGDNDSFLMGTGDDVDFYWGGSNFVTSFASGEWRLLDSGSSITITLAPQTGGATFTGEVVADTIDAPLHSNTTNGTMVAGWLNGMLWLNGDITLAGSIATADDMIGPIMAQGASRTISKGTITTMYVNGTAASSATLASRGQCTAVFKSASIVYLYGDLT